MKENLTSELRNRIASALDTGVCSTDDEEFITNEIEKALKVRSLTMEDAKAIFHKLDLISSVPNSLQIGLQNHKKKEENEKRWHSFLYEINNKDNQGHNYRYSHEDLVKRAKANSKRYIGNNVTDFSDWVFSLYIRRNEFSQIEGKLGEIEREALISERIKKRLNIPEWNDWELKYRDTLDGKSKVFIISNLLINSKPLRGKPDLIFRNKTSGEILIIDIKISNYPIPNNGWPNLKAQLWAYSHIDEYRLATNITLIGEIWGRNGKISYRRTVKWKSNDEQLVKENMELFELYRSLPNF